MARCIPRQVITSNGPLSGKASCSSLIGIDQSTGNLYYKNITNDWTLANSGGGGGGSQTWQQTLITGSVLTQTNNITFPTNSQFNFNYAGPSGSYVGWGSGTNLYFDAYLRNDLGTNFGEFFIDGAAVTTGMYSGKSSDVANIIVGGDYAEIVAPEFRFSNPNVTTGAGYVLTDLAGDGKLTLQPPSGGGGGSADADNALHIDSGTSKVYLGGNLIENTIIDATASPKTIHWNFTTSTGSTGFLIDNSAFLGIGLYVSALNVGTGINGNGGSIGVLGSSENGYGVLASSQNGVGARVTSDHFGSYALEVAKKNANTSTVVSVVSLSAESSGITAAGFGGKIDFSLQDDSGSSIGASEIRTIWTDVAHDTRSSRIEFANVDSAAMARKMAIISNGQIILDTYGYNIHNFSRPERTLTVDTTGHVVEFPVTFGGSEDANVVASDTITVSLPWTLSSNDYRVVVTAGNAASAGFKYYVDNATKSTTQFTVVLDSVVTQHVKFDWILTTGF